MSYVKVYEAIRASGYKSVYYGLIPCLKTRYVFDIEWSEGAYIGIGGIRLTLSTSGGLKYVSSGGVSLNVGSNPRQTIIVNCIPNQLKSWVSVGSHLNQEVALNYPFSSGGYQPACGNIFTPLTATVQVTSGTVNVYSLTQQVEDKGLVTAIGSAKLQAIGYDGPHGSYINGRHQTWDGMQRIRQAGMKETFFADIDYLSGVTPEGQNWLEYLNELADEGWDVAIHFSFWDANTWEWADVQAQCEVEFNEITSRFNGRQPTSFCFLGIGELSDDWKNEYLSSLYGMFLRGMRILYQARTTVTGLYDSSYPFYKACAENGSAGPPVYVHDTNIPDNPSTSSIDEQLWNDYLDTVFANGVIITGFNDWYKIHSNQEEAYFTTIATTDLAAFTAYTNGFPAVVLVKTPISSVVSVVDDQGVSIPFSASPEGYTVFEVEHGKSYYLKDELISPRTLTVNSSPNNVPFTLRRVN